MALHRCGPEISPVAWKKQTVALEEQIVTEFHTSYCKLAVLLVLVISDSPQIRPNKCRCRPPPRLLHFGTAVPYHLSTILAMNDSGFTLIFDVLALGILMDFVVL
ncbi:hypothetical protein T09_5366 [Trichinella sp. T9]|nr:hypothetical protein T09_5366 [Trichinella sp. T9]